MVARWLDPKPGRKRSSWFPAGGAAMTLTEGSDPVMHRTTFGSVAVDAATVDTAVVDEAMAPARTAPSDRSDEKRRFIKQSAYDHAMRRLFAIYTDQISSRLLLTTASYSDRSCDDAAAG